MDYYTKRITLLLDMLHQHHNYQHGIRSVALVVLLLPLGPMHSRWLPIVNYVQEEKREVGG